MYLEYSAYAQMGGKLEPEIYERYAAKAEQLIDRATNMRLKSIQPIPNSARYCVMELVSAIQADESMGGAGREISSMSNDGVSVSFAAMAASARYMEIIRGWLDGETTEAGVHRLYAGCDA